MSKSRSLPIGYSLKFKEQGCEEFMLPDIGIGLKSLIDYKAIITDEHDPNKLTVYIHATLGQRVLNVLRKDYGLKEIKRIR